MRVPVEWLADYAAIEMPTHDLAHRLTMVGLKVEAIERVGASWQDVIIGQIIEIEPHPSSNKPLWVARVDVGDGEITVVTGAPNVRQDDKAPVVLVGGTLPHGVDGEPTRIEPRPMAGITSEGMLASARELGISEEHSGIYILPADAPVGAPLTTFLGGDVLDIETNPNRPDTLSIIGIAREVAALTQQQLTLPDLDALDPTVSPLAEESIRIDVEDADLCARYSALRITGIEQVDSPSWLVRRIQAAGMRPISLLVDLTNYVMLEYGQPMHAFDASALLGDTIVVRRARPGEKLTTLDGVERTLTPHNLVIADAERAVGIAGVMGGENSEVGPGTTEIVLESATFDPVSVRRTAQALGLRSEASSRFEKGLPPEQTVFALRRYLQLLGQIVERPVQAARVSDVWSVHPEPRVVRMPLHDLHRLIGLPIPPEQAEDSLSLLGFGVSREEDAVDAVVPFWRRIDVEQSADLVEEVARIVGFDAVPATLPRRTMDPLALPPGLETENLVRERLLAAGASEATTHSLTSPAATARLALDRGSADGADLWALLVVNGAGVYGQEALTEPVVLANPATQDRSMLRLSLVPSLLDVVAGNLKHTDERLAFFEIGRTFFRRPGDQELPYERRTVGIALSGRRQPASWADPQPGPFTFYDVKGLIEAVLNALQVDGWHIEQAPHPALHPFRSAVIRLRGHSVAYLGELHPTVAARFHIEGWRVQVAEIDLDSLLAASSRGHRFHPLPRYPAAYRDVALVVKDDVPAGAVLAAVRSAGDSILESARIFDVYRGDPLPAGEKSIAVGLTFRVPGATLTQDEVGAAMARIVSRLEQDLGASLRE